MFRGEGLQGIPEILPRFQKPAGQESIMMGDLRRKKI